MVPEFGAISSQVSVQVGGRHLPGIWSSSSSGGGSSSIPQVRLAGRWDTTIAHFSNNNVHNAPNVKEV